MGANPFYCSAFWRKLRAACLDRDRHICVVPGCGRPANVADHITARPFVPHPCDADRIDNLRSLCGYHDAQVKEGRRGFARRNAGGITTVPGCDAAGMPLDPRHRWNKPKPKGYGVQDQGRFDRATGVPNGANIVK